MKIKSTLNFFIQNTLWNIARSTMLIRTHGVWDVRSTRSNEIDLHSKHCSRCVLCKIIILYSISRDTDVFFLLLHFLLKHFPIHISAERLHPDIKDNRLSFHALTCCDTTSSFLIWPLDQVWIDGVCFWWTVIYQSIWKSISGIKPDIHIIKPIYGRK